MYLHLPTMHLKQLKKKQKKTTTKKNKTKKTHHGHVFFFSWKFRLSKPYYIFKSEKGVQQVLNISVLQYFFLIVIWN